MLGWATFGLLIVNLLTVWQFFDDKARSIAGVWRVPESNLLFLAAIGGTPGAFVARKAFRHKTRKQPFSTHLWLIAMVQAGLAIGVLV
jgi:uncharacterized membrane protein YsdA (DUF1294 family)